MFNNYLKIALRNLKKQKGYSFINIVGLALGMACFLLILLYVRDELNYDRFHEKANQIYRIITKGKIADREFNIALSPPPLAKALVKEYPEVLQTARLFKPSDRVMIHSPDKTFNENRFFYADATIFEVFSLPLLLGDPKTALSQPNSIIITETAADKYFGNENPLGKILSLNNQTDFQITAVAMEVPQNSHFHFDFIASFKSLSLSQDLNWFNGCLYSYALLEEDYPADEFREKFPVFIRKYIGPQVQTVMGVSLDDFFKLGNSFEFHLQPIKDIHLYSNLDYELEANSDIKYIYIFSVIALFIIIIACINFMNLSTARSANRANEVGIRRVLGSNRSQLIRQFLAESFLMSLLAFLFALALAELLLPFFNTVSGKKLNLGFNDWLIFPELIGLMLFVGILAGIYPAFFLTSFQPVAVMKGRLKSGLKSARLRNILVVFQFSVSIVLIVGTFVVYNQLEYIRARKLGFEKEHVVVIQRAEALGNRLEAFKQKLLQNPQVISATVSNYLPGQGFDINAFRTKDATSDELQPINHWYVDKDFAQTFQLEMIAGRFFSSEPAGDSSSIIINESAVDMFGYEDPLGEYLWTIDRDELLSFQVIGVMKNFHYESLHKEIRPLTVRLIPTSDGNYISIRVRPDNMAKTLASLKSMWEVFAPGQPFDSFFLDDNFASLYRAEQRAGKLFAIFSILASFIACLGLFGLAAFTSEQRTKEIGIRKVLGASILNIITLLTKEFTKWVLVANLIAWPVAYLTMNSWLRNFAYRVSIELWVFILAAVLGFSIALATVSYQAVRAALANPTDVLRYE